MEGEVHYPELHLSMNTGVSVLSGLDGFHTSVRGTVSEELCGTSKQANK